jgi:predicted DNA-binding protein
MTNNMESKPRGGLAPMGKAKAIRNPRYNVISIRISDEERGHLNSLVETKFKSVSDFMRQSLEHFVTRDVNA